VEAATKASNCSNKALYRILKVPSIARIENYFKYEHYLLIKLCRSGKRIMKFIQLVSWNQDPMILVGLPLPWSCIYDQSKGAELYAATFNAIDPGSLYPDQFQ
jgi:hypothetical protein